MAIDLDDPIALMLAAAPRSRRRAPRRLQMVA
jgi:hypothetical protein